MDNIIYFSEHFDRFKQIEPMIREICLSAGGTEQVAEQVIDEYRRYFEQLSLMSANQDSLTDQLNHACHIILGLIIKEKLQT